MNWGGLLVTFRTAVNPSLDAAGKTSLFCTLRQMTRSPPYPERATSAASQSDGHVETPNTTTWPLTLARVTRRKAVSARGRATGVLRGVKNMGETYTSSGICHGLGNHWLSARCGKSKAQKVFPAALRCAVHASHKPWVTILGHPSNASVRPMDGLFGASHLTARISSGPPSGCSSPFHGVVTAARNAPVAQPQAQDIVSS